MIADRFILVLTIILAALYFWATAQIPSLEIGDPLGPKAFPRLLGIGLILTAVLLAGEMWKARHDKREPAEPGAAVHYLVVAGVAVWTAIYFFAFERLGYLIATTIYLAVLMAYFNRGKWIANMSTAVLFPIVSYLMFTKGLGVNLARGVLPL